MSEKQEWEAREQRAKLLESCPGPGCQVCKEDGEGEREPDYTGAPEHRPEGASYVVEESGNTYCRITCCCGEDIDGATWTETGRNFDWHLEVACWGPTAEGRAVVGFEQAATGAPPTTDHHEGRE